MSEHSKAIARRVFEELFTQGQLDAVDELFAAGYRDHDPVNEQDTRGPDGVRAEIAVYRAGSSDVCFTVEDQLAEGERVVTRWIARGTHHGELFGVEPTGNPFEVHGITHPPARRWAHPAGLVELGRARTDGPDRRHPRRADGLAP